MLRLRLRIGLGHQRTAQPAARLHQTEPALAWAHAQRHATALRPASRAPLAIPELGRHRRRRRRWTDPRPPLLPLFRRASGGPAGRVALGQTGQTRPVEAAHPMDPRARGVTKEGGRWFATPASSAEQGPGPPGILTCGLMPVDLLWQHRAAGRRSGPP